MSKYEEDVYINNHTAVWGSWWQDGQWGFACCKSMVKNSYCTGAAGIEVSRLSSSFTGTSLRCALPPACHLIRAPMRQFQAAAMHAENLAANLEAKAAENEEKRKESQLSGYKPNDVWGEVCGIPVGV